MNIRKILFATDFSEASEPAFRVAASLARDNNTNLLILHVSDREDYPVGEHVEEEPAPPITESKQLEKLVARVEGASCEWRWVHRAEPHQAEGILDFAKKEKPDMIVVGTHGRTGLSHLLAGSVAEQVIRHADCPVLSVRHLKPTMQKPST